ncbi:MAG: ABC transporter permease [Lachnospiraceae bacterium]|nr:ABC transporter permease [Lachnospiraceae bacterium]
MKKSVTYGNGGTGRSVINTIIVFAIVVAVWAAVASSGMFSSYVFPGPARVLDALWSMIKSGELARHMAASLGRVLLGFLISCVVSLVLAIIATGFEKIDLFLKPLIEFIRHIPPMSLIPLLILWFGIGETSKLIVIVLTSFFPIFLNSVAGIKGCDVKLLEVGEMLNMSKTQQFIKIRLPYAVPNILVGMQIGLGYSLKAIIGAEMIAAASGLGYMILDAQAMSRSDKVMAGIIVLGVSGLIIDYLFNLIVKRMTRFYETQ